MTAPDCPSRAGQLRECQGGPEIPTTADNLIARQTRTAGSSAEAGIGTSSECNPAETQQIEQRHAQQTQQLSQKHQVQQQSLQARSRRRSPEGRRFFNTEALIDIEAHHGRASPRPFSALMMSEFRLLKTRRCARQQRRTRSPVAWCLIPQLQIGIPEGAGAFRPLDEGVFRRPLGPDLHRLSMTLRIYDCSTKADPKMPCPDRLLPVALSRGRLRAWIFALNSFHWRKM